MTKANTQNFLEGEGKSSLQEIGRPASSIEGGAGQGESSQGGSESVPLPSPCKSAIKLINSEILNVGGYLRNQRWS